jgi:hypothetical protein
MSGSSIDGVADPVRLCIHEKDADTSVLAGVIRPTHRRYRHVCELEDPRTPRRRVEIRIRWDHLSKGHADVVSGEHAAEPESFPGLYVDRQSASEEVKELPSLGDLHV